MDGDDKMPRRSDGGASRRRTVAIGAVVIAVVVLIVAVGATVFAFRRASDHLAAVHRDTAASVGRVGALTRELAKATDERDRSLREASVARAALAQARDAHLKGADALEAERADLDAARRQAYESLVEANTRTAQVAALHSCLDGVSQALNLLAVGLVDNWQQQLQSVDPVCRQAQATTA